MKAAATFGRIGRLRERRYQLTAERRNNFDLKFVNNLETARYFERESNIAKQFNAWSVVQKTNESKHLAICRRTESLIARRNRLRELFEKEEEAYRRECQAVKSSKVPRALNYNPSLIREKRAEDSLYRPLSCRRIQSYYCGTLGKSEENSRSILKDFNKRDTGRKSSGMSMDKTNLREEVDNFSEPGNMNDDRHSTIYDNRDHKLDGYNKRMDEYKENSRSARASNLYGNVVDSSENGRTIHSAKYEYKPAAGLETCEHRPRTRRLHDSHFLLGNQTYLQESEGGGEHLPPNQKFTDRYANRSLESTNVGETAGHSIEENLPNESAAAEATNEVVREIDNPQINETEENGDEQQDETDRACVKDQEEIEEREDPEKEDTGCSTSLKDNASSCSHQNEEQQQQRQQQLQMNDSNEQRDIDREIGAKASAGRSDHRHFETEKSLPWMRMIPGDKNLSEQMFLYLTHNELKGQIQDLEKRENQASTKHQWDEALRLRDMRNRLDLARERNLYRRDDLLLDPEIKKLGMAGIEARQKLLKDREELCTNSSMYSEEAKVMWDQWVIEDHKSILEDARLQREELMKQLEENWRSLAIEDKQRISNSFKDKDIASAALQNDHDNSCTFRSASR